MTISRDPQQLNKEAWYYENPHSIEVIAECRDENGYHKTLQIRIPARKLLKSLERMGIVKATKK